MENAADALQIAGFVLIFVLALSISINAFGQARQTSQAILEYKDREYDYSYIDTSVTVYGTQKRVVRAESIVPSIYKAYKENYKIVFEFLPGTYFHTNGLYKKGETESTATVVHSIDLEKEVLGSNERKEIFIKGILYGLKDEEEKKKINTNIYLTSNPDNFMNTLYYVIRMSQFKESLGVYYQEDLDGSSDTTPEANKTKKRVITYTQMN